MRKVIITLAVLNVLLISANLLIHFADNADVELTIEGIPSLNILPETPGAKYSADNATGTSSCFTIGPYYSEKAAQLVAGNIRAFDLAVTIRSMNSKKTMNYLVYIANVPSYEAAEKITKDLKTQEVGEYSIVKSGPYKNTITFGFYKSIDKAKRKTEYIRYLGYDARYNEQKVLRKVYWVDYDEPIGASTPALSWSKAIDPKNHVQIIPRNCDQQAWYGSGAFANSAQNEQ